MHGASICRGRFTPGHIIGKLRCEFLAIGPRRRRRHGLKISPQRWDREREQVIDWLASALDGKPKLLKYKSVRVCSLVDLFVERGANVAGI